MSTDDEYNYAIQTVSFFSFLFIHANIKSNLKLLPRMYDVCFYKSYIMCYKLFVYRYLPTFVLHFR